MMMMMMMMMMKQYLLDISLLKQNIYRALESSDWRWASLEVRKFGFHFMAPIRIASEKRSVVDSEAYFVAFKTRDVHYLSSRLK